MSTGLEASHGASPWAGLHVLACDEPTLSLDPVEQGRLACLGGAAVVQLRAKHATDRQVLAWAKTLRDLTRRAGARFVVNDRFDLALASEADAVHLGQSDIPPAAIPARFRERLAIGRSTHDLEQARRACQEPCDYVAFGPLFGTTSKESEYAARGLEMLRAIAKAVGPRPLVAIGGIDLAHCPEVVRAGACGIAVISAVVASEDPVAAARALTQAISEAAL